MNEQNATVSCPLILRYETIPCIRVKLHQMYCKYGTNTEIENKLPSRYCCLIIRTDTDSISQAQVS